MLLVKASRSEDHAFRSVFAAWIGLCFGLGEFFAGMPWFPSSIAREWPRLSVAPEYLLLVYLASYHALTGVLFGAFARRFRRQGAGWFVALPFALASAWTIPEIIRGTAMTGLPILSLGYQMVGTAFFGYAPIVGLYGVEFAAALASALFGMLAFVKRREGAHRRHPGRHWDVNSADSQKRLLAARLPELKAFLCPLCWLLSCLPR